ncbi:uncharacterized protein DS421_14g467140 [Arachis hypogaea]|uniref:Uncharacterized protein n=1 Tax=Arachis hypogaea TaxID=3818 RepID=A0A444ZPG8_ARAHY|nr:uncharacterized protein DS421_14g467140 [Arachis hypogaea]RYR16024.1 hypothetical protein Ahy_B04g073011 [Arachis hypogaea]
MDAKAAQTLQFSAMLQPETMRSKPSGASSLSISREPHKKFLRVSVSVKLQPVRTSMIRRRVAPLEVTRSYENIPGLFRKNKKKT